MNARGRFASLGFYQVDRTDIGKLYYLAISYGDVAVAFDMDRREHVIIPTTYKPSDELSEAIEAQKQELGW